MGQFFYIYYNRTFKSDIQMGVKYGCLRHNKNCGRCTQNLKYSYERPK